MRVALAGGGRLGAIARDVLETYGEDLFHVVDPSALHQALQEGMDWIVSAGCRFLIPEEALTRARVDTCNLHPGLLPHGRGAHPNVWAIAHGEPAGVTVHRMDRGLDTGPVFAQTAVDVRGTDTAGTLYERLMTAARELFAATWPAIRDGSAEPSPQLPGGSYHRASDLVALGTLRPDASVTWEEALRVLRALSHPPHRNIRIGDQEWCVDLR